MADRVNSRGNFRLCRPCPLCPPCRPCRPGRRERGQILFVVLPVAVALFMAIPWVIAVGEMIHEKVRLQRAVDAASISSATWQARGLNVIADLNFALVAAGGTDLVKAVAFGGIDMALYHSILEAQKVATMAFPGAAGWHYRQVFEANSKKGSCWPLPTGIKDLAMFSLRVRRKKFSFFFIKVDLWMEEDRPDYWDDQMKTGPFIRLFGSYDELDFFIGGRWFGKKMPGAQAVAQAAPRDGTLWDPRFSARLVPVTTSIPGLDSVILH